MAPFGGSQLLVETFNQLNLSSNCLPDSISRLFWFPGFVGRKLWGWEPCSISGWSGYKFRLQIAVQVAWVVGPLVPDLENAPVISKYSDIVQHFNIPSQLYLLWMSLIPTPIPSPTSSTGLRTHYLTFSSGCVLNCFMLSSLPCLYAFCWPAIPASCYIFNFFIVIFSGSVLFICS